MDMLAKEDLRVGVERTRASKALGATKIRAFMFALAMGQSMA